MHHDASDGDACCSLDQEITGRTLGKIYHQEQVGDSRKDCRAYHMSISFVLAIVQQINQALS